MKSFSGGIYIALVTATLGGMGCGAAPSDEDVGKVQSAINIGSWTDLVNMGSTGTYTLTGNINAQGKTWTPKTFSGTFNGGNFTISNLSITTGSFFSSLTNATVKNLKLTGVKLTGSGTKTTFGGLAGSATDSNIQNCAVEVNINMGAAAAGGIVGAMYGGSIYRSYAKGSILGNIANSGGLVGYGSPGSGLLTITESYAQMTVAPDGGRAGGIIGYAYAPDIHDVYAVGNVTGSGSVGGIVGDLGCTPDMDYFLLYKTIYRGDVVDKSRSGWSGVVGTYPVDPVSHDTCTSRFTQNFYDSTLDPSSGHATPVDASANKGYTSVQLRQPTSVIGGVYCAPDTVPGRCGDNTWASPPWTAGNASEHHALLNMPGPNVQTR